MFRHASVGRHIATDPEPRKFVTEPRPTAKARLGFINAMMYSVGTRSLNVGGRLRQATPSYLKFPVAARRAPPHIQRTFLVPVLRSPVSFSLLAHSIQRLLHFL